MPSQSRRAANKNIVARNRKRQQRAAKADLWASITASKPVSGCEATLDTLEGDSESEVSSTSSAPLSSPDVEPLVIDKLEARRLPKPTPAALLDHTAFPHIIDNILTSARADVLLRFRATSKYYWKRVTPGLVYNLQVTDLTDGATQPLTMVEGANGLMFNAHTLPPPRPSPSYPVRQTGVGVTPEPWKRYNAEVGKYVAQGKLEFPLKRLLAFTQVLDFFVDKPRLARASLVALQDAFRFRLELPVVRILDFPMAGLDSPGPFPIHAHTLIVFLANNVPCPSYVPLPAPDGPRLVGPFTQRVVFNLCGQHSLGCAAYYGAMTQLSDNVRDVVFHLLETSDQLACAGTVCDTGYMALGAVLALILQAPRYVTITLPRSTPAELKEDAIATRLLDRDTVPANGPRKYRPAGRVQDVITRAISLVLTEIQMADTEESCLNRIRFVTREEYAERVGLDTWMWETQL